MKQIENRTKFNNVVTMTVKEAKEHTNYGLGDFGCKQCSEMIDTGTKLKMNILVADGQFHTVEQHAIGLTLE